MVDTAGEVEDITVLHTTNPALTGAMVRTVYSWRYRPYLFKGRYVRYCYAMRFSVAIKR
jgi:hypothetical protein